jgi:hypothetical protein
MELPPGVRVTVTPDPSRVILPVSELHALAATADEIRQMIGQAMESPNLPADVLKLLVQSNVLSGFMVRRAQGLQR